MNSPRERLASALETQLLEQCCAFEDGIAALATAISAEVAQRNSGPGAARVYMALGAHLRDGVERRLEELRRSPDL